MSIIISNLLDLPDEILLEICKYLLNAHVFYSFHGVNARLNNCISGYYRRVALSDVTFAQCHHLCRSMLPAIGAEVVTLSLSNCRSVLQGKTFMNYFSQRMSTVFPNLRKVTLTCFAGDEFDHFLQSLNNLDQLTHMEVYDLLTDQPNLFERVVNSNGQRWESIKFKTSYVDLPIAPCFSLQELTMSIRSLENLGQLLSFLPEIRYLNVTVEETSMLEARFDHLSPMIHLKHFTLRCYNHYWILEEIRSLLNCLPAIEHLSLQLSSEDERLVSSEQPVFQILPPSVRELSFALRFFYDTVDDIDQSALSKARFPMACLIDETLEQAVLHTTPYRFPILNISLIMGKQMCPAEQYRHVEIFTEYDGMSLAEAFPIITRCRRIQEIGIQTSEQAVVPLSTRRQGLQPRFHLSEGIFTTCSSCIRWFLGQTPLPALPHFPCLKRVWLLHSSREYQSLKSLLRVAPNLSELFISFDNLLPIFDDHETCQLLGQRIVHLLLLRYAPAAPTQLSEEYIPALVRVFTRLRHLQVDVTGGPSVDSIVRGTLSLFQGQSRLISLVVEGKSVCDELKSNARQWLIDQTCLRADDSFDAEFKEQTNRFLLWMWSLRHSEKY